MNVKNLSSLLLSMLTLVVLGCGGSGGGGGEGQNSSPATIALTSLTATQLINTPVIITANVLKADGTAVASGTVVTFATTSGTLSAVTTTNATGDATVTLTSTTTGTVTVTATVGSLPAKTLVVTFIDPNFPASVALTASASPANIGTSVNLTATVTPVGPNGVIADGTVVMFTASSGTVSAVTTTTNGVATANLSGITSPATVSITAAVGGVTSPEIKVNFIDPTSPSILTVSDTPGVHLINNPIPITANVVSLAGGPVPAGTPVTFTVASGTGTLTPAATTTDANGNASVTLISAVDGSVTISVSAAQATGSHTIAFTDPNKPASIALIANRTSGVTNDLGPVIMTATLTPVSATGTIADGTPVTFTIVSGTGGTLSTTTANSTGGVATVTLNSTVAGSIIVSATAGSTPVVTSNQASVLFISQPTQVTVKVRTTGTLPAGTTIGGLKAIVSASPSAGLTIVADPNGNSTDVSATGAGIGSFLTTNSNNVAAVTLALINTGGIQTGEFATLNYNVAAGSFPKASDFSIALNGSVINTLSTDISGIGVAILSVTIQ